MRCSRPRTFKVVLDIVLYMSVFLTVIYSIIGPIAPPHFQVTCDDPTIRRPYQPNTVSASALLSICLALPFVVMTALEWAVPPPGDGPSPLRQGLKRSWTYLGDLFIGAIMMYFVNEFTKVITGEPRPFYWNICAPNITSERCQQETYITLTWHDCTNPFGKSKRKLVDSMKSFPSGHASLSVFSSVFMIVYIKQRLWNRCSKLIAPWLQLLWATWTILCCQSRIWDNKHHWWDVLAGGLLGLIGALFTLHYLSNWFIRDEECSEKELISVDPNYVRHTSRFSNNSVKRLISTTSENDNHNDQHLDNRELTNINGTP